MATAAACLHTKRAVAARPATAVNIGLMMAAGFFVNGPYALITTAVSADLGTHQSLAGARGLPLWPACTGCPVGSSCMCRSACSRCWPALCSLQAAHSVSLPHKLPTRHPCKTLPALQLQATRRRWPP